MTKFVPHPTAMHDGTPCWDWVRAQDGHGYGVIGVEHQRIDKAYRVAHRLFIGPIEPGLEVDHLCRRTLCVNPSHLEAVTPRVNQLRSDSLSGRRARMTECLRGHPLAGDNLMIEYGHRRCRNCRLANRRARYHAAKQGVSH